MAQYNGEFTSEQEEALNSIRVSRIILPVFIGIAAVLYLLLRKFDPKEFATIDWTTTTFLWIGMAAIILISKHMAYATRLRILTEGAFSWGKCIELIFIWEFSSAVSPTSVGGSAVAFFVLAQEKLPTAKTATIVLYTIVLDGLFFILGLPVLYLLFGSHMVRPDAGGVNGLGAWGYYFVFAYSLMFLYSSLFFYGLFINPLRIRQALTFLTSIKFLGRYKEKFEKLGNDMVIASKELKQKKWQMHAGAFLATMIAWSSRFLLLNCLINGFIVKMPLDFWNQFELYARLKTMFVIIAFSPTPGGAGFVEILFAGFLKDYVDNSTYATVISTIWRLMSYYAYLLVGVIIIPNWIRNVINERRKQKLDKGQ